jgi:hypothetical protein
MMEYDDQCKLDPTMPLKYPCTHYNIHLATLVIIKLCTVMMSQSGDITPNHPGDLVSPMALPLEFHKAQRTVQGYTTDFVMVKLKNNYVLIKHPCSPYGLGDLHWPIISLWLGRYSSATYFTLA